MDQMEDSAGVNWLLLALSLTFMGLVATDLVTDYRGGSSVSHLILEGTLLTGAVGIFAMAIRSLMPARTEIRVLSDDVEGLQKEKEKWKDETHKLLEGLSAEIDKQFSNWQLTRAETEVGFLLLKGFSLKRIGDVRDTKLKTVQQQSQSIYQKTGLSGRSELSAFFLEDLLPPKNLPAA